MSNTKTPITPAPKPDQTSSQENNTVSTDNQDAKPVIIQPPVLAQKDAKPIKIQTPKIVMQDKSSLKIQPQTFDKETKKD